MQSAPPASLAPDAIAAAEIAALIAAARPVLLRHGWVIVRREDEAAAPDLPPQPQPSPAPVAAPKCDEFLDTPIKAFAESKKPYGLLLANLDGWLGTFSETVLAAAKAAKASGAVVRVYLRQNGQYRNVVGIEPVPTDPPRAEPPPLYGGHHEDVPF